MAERPLLVYTHPQRFFFVAKDLELLRRDHTVLEHSFNSGHALLLPWDLFRQFIFLITARIRGVRIAFVHFAGHHSVLPVLLGFRTYIIVAGSDSCSFPAIDYGSFRKRWMSRAMAFSIRRAAMILPVHASLERFRNTYSDAGPAEQGYAVHVKGPIAPSMAIPYGFDPHKWQPQSGPRDNGRVLCIANGAAFGNAIHHRKGVDILLRAAELLPDIRFTIVGADTASYRVTPANMQFVGVVEPSKMPSLFHDHGIYVQASIMEGFPNALCEAMLMGCIPIVSNVTSMPEIVGDVGPILPRRDAKMLVAIINEIRNMDLAETVLRRQQARRNVLGYTLEARLEQLKEAIFSSMAGGSLAKPS